MKTRRFYSAGLVLAMTLTLSSCIITREKSIRTVTVTGSASLEVPSEGTRLTVSVVTKDKDAVKASELNNDKMAAIQKAVKECGVSSDGITTEGFNVWEETRQVSPRIEETLFCVSNDIAVIIGDKNATGKIIDAAIKAGANRIGSLETVSGNPEQQMKQARILAIRDAEQKALTLATTSGQALGSIVSIKEYGHPGFPRAGAIPMMAKEHSGTPVSAGDKKVTVTVEAVYEIVAQKTK